MIYLRQINYSIANITQSLISIIFTLLLTACSSESTVSSCEKQGMCSDLTPVTLAAIYEDSGIIVITQDELLANVNNVDSSALTVTGLVMTSGTGTLVDNGDGTWNYTPALNGDTSVNFSYSVTNGVSSIAGTVSMNITPITGVPTTTPVVLTAIDENSDTRVITQTELLANANDVDGDALTATGLAITSGKGSLVENVNSNWTYTPALNDDTSVSFSYSVTDGALSVDGMATLDITPVIITPTFNAPTTTPVALTAVVEDSGIRIITQAELLTNANDGDGDVLTATGLAITSGAGTLDNKGDGTWNYTPALNDDTGVSFSYIVSDGTGTVSADGTASLDIIPMPETATLSWVAPIYREDNTTISLSEISGYHLYYGITPGAYPVQINIDDGSAVEVTLNNMASGTYYFVLTTIDMDGRESAYSDMVSTSI